MVRSTPANRLFVEVEFSKLLAGAFEAFCKEEGVECERVEAHTYSIETRGHKSVLRRFGRWCGEQALAGVKEGPFEAHYGRFGG